MNNKTLGFLTIVLLLSTTSVFSLNLFLQQRVARDKLDIREFPYLMGEWKGKDLKITEQEYDILETRNLVLREYVNPLGKKLFLFIIYSETNRSVFHPPEVCLMGSGIQIYDKKSEKLNFGKYKFSVNKLYAGKNGNNEIILYFYKAGNLYTDNYYLQQACFAANQVLGKHKGGATIRASMSIDKDEKATLATLKTFVAQAVKMIDSPLLLSTSGP